MVPFLQQVANDVFEKHRKDLHRLAVVFPNRRQAVFFRQAFMQTASPPVFLPRFFTIEEWVEHLHGKPVANNLTQLFLFYEAYCSIAVQDGEDKDKLQGFEQFFPMGEMLLKDFEEANGYLVAPNDIYRVLYDLEGIEKSFAQLTEEQLDFLRRFWASMTQKDRVQELFLKLWKRMPAIYERFIQLLQAQGLTTIGLAYRELANNASHKNILGSDWLHVSFVGFNAFNRAAETILVALQQQGKASFYFDADDYYLKDTQQEAGFFLRRNLDKLGLKNSLPSRKDLGEKTMPVKVSAVQGQMAQAKMVGDWLSKLPANYLPEKTAIILADETLLLQVLQSMPPQYGPVNITMGFPLKQSPVYAFLIWYEKVLVQLVANQYRSLPHTLVLEWLNHPLCDWTPEQKEKLESEILKGALFQVPLKKLTPISAASRLIFAQFNHPFDLFSRLRQMLEGFHQKALAQSDHLLSGVIAAVWNNIQPCEPLLAGLKPTPSALFILHLVKRQLDTATVPFEGEPLQGIQLMGLLESRGIDFDHVLLLGVSEGSLPRKSGPKTFFPDGIRRAFGLPVPEHQDAIFAYVFYRLFHQCTQMQMVYNAQITNNSTGEPSRFIKQIAFESNMAVEWAAPTLPLEPSAPSEITVQKSAWVMGHLKRFYQGEKPQGISPSAINTYLACRLQFFFKYLLNLKKPDTLEATIDAKMFGSIVHAVMENLYKALQTADKPIAVTVENIQQMREKVDALSEQALWEKLSKNKGEKPSAMSGLQQVVHKVVVQYVHKFLDLDEEYAPFTIIHLEQNIQTGFPLKINGKTEALMLSGYIDRVDEKAGIFRMVDYKTGSDKNEFHSVEGLFKRESSKQNKAVLQTLLYSWMFKQQNPGKTQFEPALLPLRHFSKTTNSFRLLIAGKPKTELSFENLEPYIAETIEHLKLLLSDLFDPEVPFNQTEDLKTCEYCDFKDMCRR